jgi:hypothetical protein
MTFCINTSAPLSEKGLHYSLSNLDTLNELKTTNLTQLNNILVQQLRSILTMSVLLVTHLLANLRIMTSMIAFNCDYFYRLQDEEITVRDITQNLVT